MFIKLINMKIGIIGGSDGLGKTLIYYFRDEFDVTIPTSFNTPSR